MEIARNDAAGAAKLAKFRPPNNAASALRARRIAAAPAEAIRRCGHFCVGPAGGLSEVLRLIENDRVDAAILDREPPALRHARPRIKSGQALVAGIHDATARQESIDGRDKPGHD
jgi:hypothetical protein